MLILIKSKKCRRAKKISGLKHLYLFFTVTPACASNEDCPDNEVCANPGAADAACGMYTYSCVRVLDKEKLLQVLFKLNYI